MLVAIAVFVIAYGLIATEKFPRHWVALAGGAALLLLGVLSPLEALTYVNWETIGLLAGMFALVAILHESGFFQWLAMTAVRKVNYHPTYLFVILVVLSAFLAMWMDSITVMMFMAALTIQLCLLLMIDPVPIIIAEVCAANTGGAATLVGDPPNVILGTTLGFNFGDFITHTGPISAIASVVLLIIFYLLNRKNLRDAHAQLTDDVVADINAIQQDPLNKDLTRIGLIGFGSAVVLLIFHHPLSHATHLPITAAVCALVPAIIAMILVAGKDRKKIFSKLLRDDLESLVFFAGLFILIGGLEKVLIFEKLAEVMAESTSGSHQGLVMALHWGPGLLSGVLDNVPMALAMSYVLKDLAAHPEMPALALMVWSLALGVDIGGNLTPIGASANVVAYSIMEKHHGPVGWKRWIIIAVPPTIAVMIVASSLVALKGHIGWY
jgi:Na+/H+ antiporter NhaD/arsenite permease-like protein